jgi:hypothetical protein
MIEVLNGIIPYISGFYTLPWILVGFLVTIGLSKKFGEQKINGVMKKIGSVILFFFIPFLLFKIFLNIDFGSEEILFTMATIFVILFTYLLAYFFAVIKAKKMLLKKNSKQCFIKTILTNQGRSSAFIGSALLAYWDMEAGIYLALVGIFLFAIIPFILSRMHKKEANLKENEHLQALPTHLKIYPWYLISFVIVAVFLHGNFGITIMDLGESGIVLNFYTALTIPLALYYVGSGIHPHDLKKSEIKKLFNVKKNNKSEDLHWSWVRNIMFLTMIITPLLISLFFGILLIFDLISNSWFSVIVINSVLPITSTNMFLLPYGIDKRSTAHAITWTTVIAIPIVVLLIYLFSVCLI